jgi:cell division protein FtsB
VGLVRLDASTFAWLLPTALLVLAIVSVPLLVLDQRGLPRYRSLRDERAALVRDNDALRSEVRALARDVEALRSDESSVERIARDELGMIRPGEILFQFPE